MEGRFLVAVYGSLLSGLGNHRVIQGDNTEFLGEFISEPVYSLYDLGFFPGLHENGKTAVKMEVYSVDKNTAINVDRLEGYKEGVPPTFYDKTDIETPWGTASVYIYMGNPGEERLVESGDWREHLSIKYKKENQI